MIFVVCTATAIAASAQTERGVSGLIAIDPTNRTVTTSNFFVAWNTGNDVEAITTFNWAGGRNVTNSYALDTCDPNFPGTIEYFGDSFAPPDPWLGGLALVGGGTTTHRGQRRGRARSSHPEPPRSPSTQVPQVAHPLQLGST